MRLVKLSAAGLALGLVASTAFAGHQLNNSQGYVGGVSNIHFYVNSPYGAISGFPQGATLKTNGKSIDLSSVNGMHSYVYTGGGFQVVSSNGVVLASISDSQLKQLESGAGWFSMFNVYFSKYDTCKTGSVGTTIKLDNNGALCVNQHSQL